MLAWVLVLFCVVLATQKTDGFPCGKCMCFLKARQDMQYVQCTKLQQVTPLIYPPSFSRHRPTVIYIENNKLGPIPNDLFSNFTDSKLVYISLRNSNIETIPGDLFTNLSHLIGLDLSWNAISVNQLEKSFHAIKNDNFQRLNISHMNISQIPDTLFSSFRNCKKINISLTSNGLSSFNYRAFEMVPGVDEVRIGRNRLTSISFPDNFTTSMTRFKADNNRINSFPNFCKNNTRFPHLKLVNFQWNFMSDIKPEHFNCLEKLERLRLNGNILSSLKPNMFAGLRSIQTIFLSESFALRYIENYSFNNSNLERVFFRKNFLYTQDPTRNLNLFEGCPSMTLLNLADNIFDKTSDKKFDELFRPLKNLTTLIMGGCRLTRIPPAVTKYLLNLRELVLYNNRIGTWPDGTLVGLSHLQIIYMRLNVITSITESMFPTNFRKNALRLDFSDNPFQCSCDLKWFIDWMKNNQSVFHLPSFSNSYKCFSPVQFKGKHLRAIPLSDNICLLDLNSKIITLTGTTLLIVLMVVGSLMYIYRWQIRYLIYMLRYKHRQEVDTRQYEYDAFVAYSTEDRPWVIRTLMPVLEGQASFKLCIHDRDFEVGKLIVDNIVDCIDASRSLVIILSNSFAQSGWCQFELALIQRHVLENGQRLLVLVMLEEIETRHVTKSIQAMLQTTTYLLWGNSDYAQKVFFNRLRMLLKIHDGRKTKRRLSV